MQEHIDMNLVGNIPFIQNNIHNGSCAFHSLNESMSVVKLSINEFYYLKQQTNFFTIIKKNIYKYEYDIELGNLIFFSFLPFELHNDLFNEYYTKIKTGDENHINVNFDDLMENICH